VGGYRPESAPKTRHGGLPPDLSRERLSGSEQAAGEANSQDADQIRRTWGTTELSRAFSNANCADHKLSPTDRLLVIELYGMCNWPDVPAPPAAATTFPVTYAFLGQRIGLKRSGAERAVERLRERRWVSTELDENSGYLVYTVHVGTILKDLDTWGPWSTRDALDGRAPSRRARPQRSNRWGRAPRPRHLRHRPRAMPIVDLVNRWRCIWPDAPDPTATLAALLQDGAVPKQLHRALDSLEGSGLASPRPSFIRDRHERLRYLDGGPAADPGPAAAEPEPAAADPKPAGTDPKPADTDPEPAAAEPEPAGTDPKPAGTDPKHAGTDPKPAGADPEPAGADPEPADADPEPAALAGPAGMPSASPGPGWSGRHRSSSSSPGATFQSTRPDEAERSRLSERLKRGLEATARRASGQPKARPPDTAKPVSTRIGNETWTTIERGSTTAAGHGPERARADIPKTSHPPDREGEL